MERRQSRQEPKHNPHERDKIERAGGFVPMTEKPARFTPNFGAAGGVLPSTHGGIELSHNRVVEGNGVPLGEILDRVQINRLAQMKRELMDGKRKGF
jgi:hypothetical protein